MKIYKRQTKAKKYAISRLKFCDGSVIAPTEPILLKEVCAIVKIKEIWQILARETVKNKGQCLEVCSEGKLGK